MKTNSTFKKKTIKLFTPREAALHFVRPYVIKGDVLYLSPGLQSENKNYSIKIVDFRCGSIYILTTKLNGKKSNGRFSLSDIIEELTSLLKPELHSSANGEINLPKLWIERDREVIKLQKKIAKLQKKLG